MDPHTLQDAARLAQRILGGKVELTVRATGVDLVLRDEFGFAMLDETYSDSRAALRRLRELCKMEGWEG